RVARRGWARAARCTMPPRRPRLEPERPQPRSRSPSASPTCDLRPSDLRTFDRERRPSVKITGLRLRELTGTMRHEGEFWEERLVRPLDVYPEHRREGNPWAPARLGEGRSRVRAVFLQVDTDEGVSGLGGPIAHEIAYIVDRQFRGLLAGEDPRATERIWDKLYRHAVHGRKGEAMM